MNPIAPPDPHRAHWMRVARQFVRRWNFGWFVQGYVAPFGILLVACAVVVCALRSYAVTWWPWVFAGVLPVAGVLAWHTYRSVRSRLLTMDGALAEVDDAAGLQGRLISANAGVGAWPPPATAFIRLRWRPTRAMSRVLAPVAMLVAASLAPLPQPVNPPTLSPPPQLAILQDIIDELQQNEALDKDALQALQERVESLKAEPAGQWYSHASLEATDVLQARMTEHTGTMAGAAFDAAAALENLASNLEDATEGGGAGATETDLAALADALRNLDAAGDLTLDPELARQLRDAAANPRAMDAERLKDAAERLRNLAEACQAQYENLEGSEQVRAFPDRTRGSGGIQRGPGDAPLVLGNENPETAAAKLEALRSAGDPDMLPGDTIGLSATAPQPADPEPAQASALLPEGRGGDVVWTTAVTPEERAVLQRYFD